MVKDVALSRHHGVVTIRRSKTGLRFNIDEAVAINDMTPFSLWELCHLERLLSRTTLIWPRSASAFRNLFSQGLHFFKIGDLNFAPYSIRRGGATHSCQVSQSIESILLRGRWRALRVARLYIEAGQAELAQLYLSKQSQRLLNSYKKDCHPACCLDASLEAC